MVIKVGINGFGRIGRIMFRTCFQNSDIEVAAINDPAIDVEYICYLIKFDSVHGNFNGKVSFSDGDIEINGNKIKVFREKQPSTIPWNVAGVQYVIESSGMFTSFEKAVGHLSVEGVRRVLITAPSGDVPMMIQGVNDDKMHPGQKVISCASSTLYCLAPIMKVLESNFGVSEGFVTSIHAMTPSLKPLDGLCLRGKHWRDYRSIHQNIIPAMTGAYKALGKIMPQLKDKMIGLAFRVPIVNVSVLDLTVRLNRDTNIQNIVKCVEDASKTYLKGVIDLSSEEAVSSDFIRDTHSSILDVNSSMQLRPNFYKLICWYENEYSYACRVVDSVISSEKQFSQAKIFKGIKTDIEDLDDKLTNAIDKSLGSGCSSKPLSDMLRSFSKSLDFKIKSHCSSLNRSGHIASSWEMNNQSEIMNFSSEDTKLHNINSKISQYEEKNKQIIKKSNELNSSEKMVESKTEEQRLIQNNKIYVVASTTTTDDIDEFQSSDSCNCTKCIIAQNRKMITREISKTLAEIDTTTEENCDTEPRVKGIINTESTEMDRFNVKTLYDIDKEDKLATSDRRTLTSKEAAINLQPESQSNEDWQINCYKIKDCFLTKKKEIKEKIYRQFSHTAMLGNVITKEDINVVNMVGNSSVEDKTGSMFLGKANNDEHKNKKTIDKQNQIICENVSLRLSNLKVSKRKIDKKVDIYDKLDSTSASNSENSFHVNEKKSQVICINDLTNSLEDLARLEKICKIIEISDDLSDQLFSKLQTRDAASSNDRKWSFKDLCETIKLDDFCDKVFRE